MRVKLLCLPTLVLFALVAGGCGPPERLTPEIAEEVVMATMLETEPAYAEVPSSVRWSPESPRDEFDQRSITTLDRLQSLGLVTLRRTGDSSSGAVEASQTEQGRRLLGVVPSARGPALRGRVASRKLQGIGAFTPHPTDPRSARVEVLWTYEDPTPLHGAFAPVADRTPGVAHATVLSIGWIEGAWRGKILIRKTRPTSRAGSAS